MSTKKRVVTKRKGPVVRTPSRGVKAGAKAVPAARTDFGRAVERHIAAVKRGR